MSDAPQQVPPEKGQRPRLVRQVVFIAIWLLFSGVSIYFLIRIFGQH